MVKLFDSHFVINFKIGNLLLNITLVLNDKAFPYLLKQIVNSYTYLKTNDK